MTNRSFREDLQQQLRDSEFAEAFGAAQAKSSLALTLAEARRKAGFTQKKLAVKAGVTQAYIAKLEGGDANPTFGRIGELLATIGLSLTTGTTALNPYEVPSSWGNEWTINKFLAQAQKSFTQFRNKSEESELITLWK